MSMGTNEIYRAALRVEGHQSIMVDVIERCSGTSRAVHRLALELESAGRISPEARGCALEEMGRLKVALERLERMTNGKNEIASARQREIERLERIGHGRG